MSKIALVFVAITGMVCSFAASAQDDYKIGVYYFGVWSQEGSNIAGSTIWRDGTSIINTDPWAGALDYYNGENIHPAFAHNPDEFNNRKPAIGWYDDRQIDTLETHIKQAKANGIDYFNFYWYWNDVEHIEKDRGIPTFFNARNRDDIEFAISIASHPWGVLSIPNSDFDQVVDRLVNQYISKNNYLKTLDGRPLIFLLDYRGIGDLEMPESNSFEDFDASEIAEKISQIELFIEKLRDKVKSVTGLEPYISLDLQANASNFHPWDVQGGDALSCLAYGTLAIEGGERKLTKYKDALVGFLGWAANQTYRPVIPCMMSDFNEKPRAIMTNPQNSADDLRFVTDWTPENLANVIANVKTFSDGLNSSPVNGYINIYSWNEWREGGNVVEPNTDFGNRVAASLAQGFGLTTTGDNQCKTYGDCTQSDHDVSGALDVANCDLLEGWVRDEDFSMPLRVDFYKGGAYSQGGVFVSRVTADLHRPDLPYLDQYHGFSIETPVEFITGSNESVYAYGISTDANGNADNENLLLNQSPLTVNCPPPAGC
jgi:hypothetical protein